MAELTRFSVSVEKDVLEQFERQIRNQQYPTRSKAIADLIRESLVEKEWAGGDEIAGAVILVYDHHKRDLTNKLTHIQHDFHHLIISTQHMHLDHDNCLEIVAVKGKPGEVQDLAERLRAAKGVKHGSLAMATTGRAI